MKKKLLKLSAMSAVVAAGLAGIPAAASAASSADSSGAKAGYLTCNTANGWGFIFGSSRSIHCEYTPTSGTAERYNGSITKFGIDIGYLSSAVIVWAVLAPTSTFAPGSLAGNYAGATASAAFGAGLGANVLVGGSGNHFMLQPVSIEGETGLNVAAGIASLTLEAVK